MFGAHFGAPGGGSGPGASRPAVFISVPLEVLGNWVDPSSVAAVTAVASHGNEQQTGLCVIDVASILVPQVPLGIHALGLLPTPVASRGVA